MIDSIKKLLILEGATVAVAESITAGKLQDAFASISGSSSFFEGGITAYNLTHKVNILGVNYLHAKEVNCVSERVADEMSKGISDKMKSDYGISTTGYAEPWPEEDIEFAKAYVSIYGRLDKKVLAKAMIKVVNVDGEHNIEVITKYASGNQNVTEGVIKNTKNISARNGFRDFVAVEVMCIFVAVLGHKLNNKYDK